jgi:hypothetical protein
MPAPIIFSIIGWTLLLIIPLLASFLMLYNKRAGIVTVRRYSVFVIVLSLSVILMPDYLASEPMTHQEKSDSISQAFVYMVLMVFVVFSTFMGNTKNQC